MALDYLDINLAGDIDIDLVREQLLDETVEIEDVELVKHNLELIRVLCKQALSDKRERFENG